MSEENTTKWTSRGTLEAQKFDYRRKQYYEYMDYLNKGCTSWGGGTGNIGTFYGICRAYVAA